MSMTMYARARAPFGLPQWTRRSQGADISPTTAGVARVAGNVRGISVAIIHHNPIAREGLSLMLSGQQDMEVVATCRGDGDSLGSPDVILLSLNTGDTDAIRTVTSLVAAAPAARIIVLAASTEVACVAQHGVFGFVLEQASPEELLRTIRSVARGIHVWPRSIAKPLFSQRSRNRIAHNATAGRTGSGLTRREREVMNLVAQGMRTREIAEKLGIAFFTVRSHVRNLMEKLDIHSRLQIAVQVHRQRVEQWSASAPPVDRRTIASVEQAPLLERRAM